jgi:serine/threonine protein kinase
LLPDAHDADARCDGVTASIDMFACVQKPAKASMEPNKDFFSEYGEANRYAIKEVIGKGSYGVVCSAIDNYTREKVAIKKIKNVFEHVSDAQRILREIKLLRLLKHPGTFP